MRFALRLAWRDFRAKPSRFLLYILAIAVGVAALTAIEAFRRGLTEAIEGQGRELLGADLSLRSRRAFTDEQEKVIATWPHRVVRSVSFRTLMTGGPDGNARLVEAVAIEENFPFYGGFSTEPPEAGRGFQAQPGLLVDEGVMGILGLKPGDTVTLGGEAGTVAGGLNQSPGEIPARAFIAPKVYVPMRLVPAGRLNQPGTMARHEVFLAGPSDAALPAGVLEGFAARARKAGLEVETVASRRAQLLGGTDRIGRYLGFMGFGALLMACLGVAGAVHYYIEAKRPAVAQLRCIGATLGQAAGVFVVQLAAMALIGSTLGAVLGLVVAQGLPVLLAEFLPLPVGGEARLDAAGSAWLVGAVFTLLAGLFPITRLRWVHPLHSLRGIAPERRGRIDLAGGLALALMGAVVLVVAVRQLGSLPRAMAAVGGMLVVIGLLAVTGLLARRLCRLAVRPGWSYPVRLGISGLYRPQNQTILLVVSFGIGIFLLNTIDVLERHLLRDFEQTAADRPNLAMIDIQVDQREVLRAALDRHAPQEIYEEPMITMRLAAINGVMVEQLDAPGGERRPNWALKREYRTTYRNHQKPAIEKIVAGTWVDRLPVPSPAVIPVSLEEGIAEALRVGVGDRLRFDIHGEFFETEIANLREVDWKSMQPNFFVLFPEGVLEAAPQSLLVFARVGDLDARTALQREIAGALPNVTIIDISMMLEMVSGMMRKLSAAVRVIAVATLAAGWLVLVAVVRAGRHQRMREGVLLRTVGAPRSVVVRAQLAEVAALALAAVGSGLVLSWIAAGILVHRGFELTYRPDPLAAWPYVVAVLAAVLAGAWATGRAATATRPAQAWRVLSMNAS
jgi:putative ABC transport system permease protein